ncbi:MAG: N4-gp56 family major capsid protein [Deltaproteobacteria bacterium]|nr:N4-gp56 family major capsid protein [Deltaproteobacteria bacterium]
MAKVFTWAYDALTGVYKNHKLSAKMMKVAAGEFIIAQFSKNVSEYGKGMGESITIPHYKAMAVPANNGELTEDVRIPIDTLVMGSRTLSIKEFGRGVEFTSLAQDLSVFDPEKACQKALMQQMHHCMDNASASALKSAKVCFIPTGLTSGTWDVDGTPSTVATQNMNKSLLGLIRDYMVKDLHIPPYEARHYIGLFSTKALRGLKDDKGLEDWFKYLREGDVLYTGELGRVEMIRLIEVTNESALSNSVGSGGVLGEGIVFGDEALARLEIESPHLLADPNYKSDFGRRKAVAWYGKVAYGTYWDTANDGEAKIIRVCSA